MRQMPQTKLFNEPASWIAFPHAIPPPFGEKRVETLVNPPIQLRKEAAHMRFFFTRLVLR